MNHNRVNCNRKHEYWTMSIVEGVIYVHATHTIIEDPMPLAWSASKPLMMMLQEAGLRAGRGTRNAEELGPIGSRRERGLGRRRSVRTRLLLLADVDGSLSSRVGYRKK